jgi:hypothetical protein
MSRPSKVIKTAISLSPKVMTWGKALAEEKGFGSNFSAYIADLIRRDNDLAEGKKLNGSINHSKDGDGIGNISNR